MLGFRPHFRNLCILYSEQRNVSIEETHCWFHKWRKVGAQIDAIVGWLLEGRLYQLDCIVVDLNVHGQLTTKREGGNPLIRKLFP